MRGIYYNCIMAFLVSASIALAGCEAGEANLAGVGGDGTAGDPFVLPSENQAGVDQGIEDYLDAGGHWKFPYDALAFLVDGGVLAAYGDIVYDTLLDRWLVSVSGTTYTLSLNVTDDLYRSPDCVGIGTCVELFSFDNDDPLTSQYGTFGAIHVDDGTNVSVAQIYYGLKTPAANMPAGSATYNGEFIGEVALAGGPTYTAMSTATISANFDGFNVTLNSAGDVTDDSDLVVGTYSLTGTATIAGNSYFGLGSATFTPSDDADPFISFVAADAFEGAFYGPSAEQTAGAFRVESVTGDLLYGGFWAEQ